MPAIGKATVASMRPQRNAAENLESTALPLSYRPASMRPQRNAAENTLSGVREAVNRAASMRPQRNAAENVGWGLQGGPARDRFNEAAA